jgi:NADPH:quinone reductase-like Zn-dependent oxidoreductase
MPMLPALAATGVGVAFDTVGGEATKSLVPTVREGGILVTIASGPPEDAARERGVRAELLVMKPRPDQLALIAELVAAADVRVEVAEALSLTDTERAHELSEAGTRAARSSLRS